MPDAIGSVLGRVQRRWMVRACALAVALGGAVFAIALLAAPLIFGLPFESAVWAAVVAGVAAALAGAARAPRLSAVDAAAAVERVDRSLDNLLVTAAELDARPRPVAAEMRAEVIRQAEQRAGSVDASQAVPLLQPVIVAVVVVIGCLTLGSRAGRTVPEMMRAASLDVARVMRPGAFQVQVTPPAYTRRASETFDSPARINVIAGSRVEIPAIGRDWIATESAAIEVRMGADVEPRLLSLIVMPDTAPSIQIVTPGRDTAFAEPSGRVAIAIQSTDDLGLTSLALRFTKASGGGENVAFTDGDVPIRLERRSERDWRGSAELDLAALGLADGDIVVYRAVVRDTNPAGGPVSSDQFLIEIGKNAEIADAGFALPTEEKKYAISQQMVIYRTEALLKRPRGGAAASEWLNESRGLAMDQRMVRAEVVFLGGGEVEDEVEEAAHSHELAEGRLQNTGRAEMLLAINAMSRAEALLNDGNAKEALVFERQALVHLERALDRRRYFLRTLPDRSRIDATRRLTGDRREAQSWERQPASPVPQRSLDALRQVMRALAAPSRQWTVSAATSLAARLAAIDPTSLTLQNAAVSLASARDDSARQAAAQSAMTVLTAYALTAMPASAAIELRADPLAGRLADELRPRQ